MTRHRSFKRLVRARMSKTGEGYTAARANLLAAQDSGRTGQMTCTAPMCRDPSDLRFANRYAARWYSLITPSSTFRRCTGVSSGTTAGSPWSGGRWCRDWCGRCPL